MKNSLDMGQCDKEMETIRKLRNVEVGIECIKLACQKERECFRKRWLRSFEKGQNIKNFWKLWRLSSRINENCPQLEIPLWRKKLNKRKQYHKSSQREGNDRFLKSRLSDSKIKTLGEQNKILKLLRENNHSLELYIHGSIIQSEAKASSTLFKCQKYLS